MQGAGVLCLMDIAAGMEHLHSLGVLHVSIPRMCLDLGLSMPCVPCRTRSMHAALSHSAGQPS